MGAAQIMNTMPLNLPTPSPEALSQDKTQGATNAHMSESLGTLRHTRILKFQPDSNSAPWIQGSKPDPNNLKPQSRKS